MTWSTFWIEFTQFVDMVGRIFVLFPPIIVSMVTAPMLFAIMYGFVHLVRGLRT